MIILSLFSAFIIITCSAYGANRDIGNMGGSNPPVRDADRDGYIYVKYGGDDCNDLNPAIHPNAVEICGNGIDEDCSGTDLPCDYDSDNDGYDAIPYGDDCNDNDPAVNPGADEICGNDIDENCDGTIEQCPQEGDVVVNSVFPSSLVHDQTFTMTGSGFGNREIAPESFFETWDWGVNESFVDIDDSPWSVSSGNPPGSRDAERFSNEDLRNGHGLNARSIRPDRITGSQINDITWRSGLNVRPGDKVYMSTFIWSTYGGAQQYGPDCPQQWKIWGPLNHGNPASLTPPGMRVGWNAAGGPNDVPPLGAPFVGVQHECGDGSDSITSYGWGIQPEERTWWQIEFEYQVATARYANDGYLRVWFNGQLAGEGPTQSWCTDEQNNNVIANGYVYDGTLLRNYIQWQPTSCVDLETRTDIMRFDDIVFQKGTWARVVLGNAATWDSCTIRDYQTILGWSENSITVKLNQGAYEAGQTAWLYVINNDGIPSSGYPVTIGQ